VRAGLTRGALSSLGVDVALAAAALFAAPVMVRTLGPHPYGLYVLVTVLAGQLGFLQLGLAPAVTRRVAEGRGSGDAAAVRATEQVAWLMALGSAALVAAAFLAAGPAFFARAGGLSERTLLAAAAAVAVQPLVGVSQALLLGRERFGALASVRLAQGLVRTLAGVVVVVAGGSVAAVLTAQAAIDLSTALAVLALDRAAPVAPGPRGGAARALLALGLPFAVSGVLAALLVDGEKLALGWARSLDQLTYYAVPFSAVFRLAVVPGALATVLAPRLSALAASGQQEQAAALVRRTTRVSAAVLAAAAAPLVACAPEGLTLWLGADFAQRAADTTRLLLVAVVANGIASPACTVVRAGGRPATLVVAYALELPLHIAAVYALVSGWGIAGAAAAWLLRAVVDVLVQRGLAVRVTRRPLGDGWALAGGGAVLLAFALGCSFLPSAPWPLRLAVGALLGGLALAGGLDREDWTALRRAAGLRPRGAVAA
jgi:O-antigen/teichoic acid export membrane protein